MSNKRYRLSISFSLEDEEQGEAAVIIRNIKRGKGDFISKAINYYIKNNPAESITEIASHDKELSERLINKYVLSGSSNKEDKEDTLNNIDLSKELDKLKAEKAKNKPKKKKVVAKPKKKVVAKPVAKPTTNQVKDVLVAKKDKELNKISANGYISLKEQASTVIDAKIEDEEMSELEQQMLASLDIMDYM